MGCIYQTSRRRRIMQRGTHDRGSIIRRALLLSAVVVPLLAVLVACGGGQTTNTPQQAPAAQQQAPASQTQPAAQSQPPAGPSQAPAAQAQAPGGQAQAPAGVPTKCKEAPNWAVQFKAGKLPAVGQRRPKTPLVLTQIESVGTYGGTRRTTINGPADNVWFDRVM